MQFSSFFLILLLIASCAFGLSGCDANLRPETRALKRELEDSLSYYMNIRNDDAFLREYIAFNVRFALRNQFALADSALKRELDEELSKMALVQAAQKRVHTIELRKDSE